MEHLPEHSNTRAGTAGGTLLVLFLQIGSNELLKTTLVAGVGAAVSFCMSVVLKWCLRKLQKK